MALEMRVKCESCGKGLDDLSEDAFICSFECTFCQSCVLKMRSICPNCGGDLKPRPTRKPQKPS
jgi:uncharacterized protein